MSTLDEQQASAPDAEEPAIISELVLIRRTVAALKKDVVDRVEADGLIALFTQLLKNEPPSDLDAPAVSFRHIVRIMGCFLGNASNSHVFSGELSLAEWMVLSEYEHEPTLSRRQLGINIGMPDERVFETIKSLKERDFFVKQGGVLLVSGKGRQARANVDAEIAKLFKPVFPSTKQARSAMIRQMKRMMRVYSTGD